MKLSGFKSTTFEMYQNPTFRMLTITRLSKFYTFSLLVRLQNCPRRFSAIDLVRASSFF